MSPTLVVILGIIALSLTFDFFNGFHDAANSVATVVTTRVLSPMQAVLWAAFFNFVAAFVFGTGVAKTISEKLIDPHAVDIYVILGGVVGAIIWDIITWLMALPTSSSHALISGLAGAAIAKGGFNVILIKGWIPVLAFLVLSPIIGLILGYLIMTAVSWLSFRTERHKAQGIFAKLQLFSAGAYSLGHGTNDAQKTMGIIVALLIAGGKKEWAAGGVQLFGHKHEIALWIILSCHAAMALGTMFGGWRIVKTMGSRITPHLRPVGGFSAELPRPSASPPSRMFPSRPRMLSVGASLEWARRGVRTPCAGNGTAHHLGLGLNFSRVGFDRGAFLSPGALRDRTFYPCAVAGGLESSQL